MVSIIVAAYNVEKYVEKSIKSVVNQTYEDIEIIIIDDGSTDKTNEICMEWAKRDKRIRLYRRKNSGVAAARNFGLSVAEGEYVLFVDSDDYIDCKMVEFMVDAIGENDVVICREKAFSDENEFENVPVQAEKYTLDRIENRNELVSHFADEFTGPAGWPWNKLYRKTLIGNNRFIDGRFMEDLFFNSDVFKNVKKAVWISDRLYYYRQRQGSIMNSKTEKVFSDYSDALLHERQNFYPFLDITERKKMAGYFLRKIYRIMKEAKKAGFKTEAEKIKKQFKKLYSEDIKYVTDRKELLKIKLYYISSFFC